MVKLLPLCIHTKAGGGTPLLSLQLIVTGEYFSMKIVPKGDRETEGWSEKRQRILPVKIAGMMQKFLIVLTDNTDGNIG